MKKWFYLILIAVLPVMATSLASCDNDDDLPDVNITLDVAKGTVDNNVIYVVRGDTIEISSVIVTNNEANKAAALTNVTYYWDGYYYAPSVFSPFGMTFPTSEFTALGKHSIDITCTVLAVDKSIATAAVSYPVMVVESEADLPTNSEPSTVNLTTTLK